MRRRNKLRVPVHFVWATKSRLPLIVEECEGELHRCIRAICADMGCDCLAIGGTDDHVHLLTALSSTVSMGQLMKRVKGASSKAFSAAIRPGAWFAWQPNYAAFAVSPSRKLRVIRYIEDQKRHHKDGTLWPEAEETDEAALTDDL